MEKVIFTTIYEELLIARKIIKNLLDIAEGVGVISDREKSEIRDAKAFVKNK